jgi:parvulin-like peptidyl-prolyl isomerase
MFTKYSLMRIVVVMLLGLSIMVVSCAQPKLGTELVYKADLSAWVGSEDEAMTNSISVIRARLDAYDLKGATVERNGTDQIVVQLPSVKDIDEAVTLIGSTAQLEFKETVYDSSGNPVWDSSGNYQWIPATAVDSSGKEVPLTGQYLKNNAKVVFAANTNAPEVSFEFNSEGATLFSEITGRLIGKPLGIFLDNQLISSPTVKAQIGAAGVIDNITLDEARNLVIDINAGAMPCPLTLVSPTPTRTSPSPIITLQQPVAAINNTTISMDYFVKMLRFYSLYSIGNTNATTFPYQVLQQIENDELVRQAAPGLGIQVTSDEVTEKINNDLISANGGGGNITGNITQPQTDLGKMYQQFLNYVRISGSEYRQVVEATLLTQKLKDQIKQSIPTEGKQVYVYAIKVDNEGNATEVENRLQNGEDFATLATEYSTDNITKQYGGNLGWLPQGILLPELDQAVFILAAGNVSEPIVTTTGYYIIKVAEIDNNKTIDDYYRQTLASNAFANWFKEQRNIVEIREYLDQAKATWAMNHIT